MTPRVQKRLAIVGVIVATALFVAANAHLLTVALRSQPECMARAHAEPAKRAC